VCSPLNSRLINNIIWITYPSNSVCLTQRSHVTTNKSTVSPTPFPIWFKDPITRPKTDMRNVTQGIWCYLRHKRELSTTRGCIQKFPDWPPGARIANDTSSLPIGAVVSLFCVSQSSEFCRHDPLCCFSTSVYCCCCLFRYRLGPETFGYTLVRVRPVNYQTKLDSLYNVRFFRFTLDFLACSGSTEVRKGWSHHQKYRHYSIGNFSGVHV
jgi:hypothetical protein